MKRSTLLRWLIRGGLGLLATVVLVVGTVFVASERRIWRTYPTAVENLVVSDDPAVLARGAHLVRSLANCVDCHGDDLGGKVIAEDAAVVTLAGPNLTKGGLGASLATEDWVRAMTRGVGKNGHSLLLMPADDYKDLGREDLAAIIAYARSLPAVEREVPKSKVGPVGRALMALGQLPLLVAERIDHRAPLRDALTPEPTAKFGEYLAKSGGCLGCHGPTLAGGPIPGLPPGTPPAADLRPSAIGRFDDATLERVFRAGIKLDGSQLHPVMPWRAVAQMSELEMKALIAYLRSVPAGEGAQASAR